MSPTKNYKTMSKGLTATLAGQQHYPSSKVNITNVVNEDVPVVSHSSQLMSAGQTNYNTSFKSAGASHAIVRQSAPTNLQAIADNWQVELDARDHEFEERLQHQMAVHHAELLQERNSRMEIQRLYESIQIEMK